MTNEAPMQATAFSAPLAEDMIDGIKAISEYVGMEERQIYHMATSGVLPGVFKIGRKWCGLKSEIRNGLMARARRVAAE